LRGLHRGDARRARLVRSRPVRRLRRGVVRHEKGADERDFHPAGEPLISCTPRMEDARCLTKRLLPPWHWASGGRAAMALPACCSPAALAMLRRSYGGVTAELRWDGLEIRRWLRSLDGLGDAGSWLETRALARAWMPLWRRRPGLDDGASPWFIPLAPHKQTLLMRLSHLVHLRGGGWRATLPFSYPAA